MEPLGQTYTETGQCYQPSHINRNSRTYRLPETRACMQAYARQHARTHARTRANMYARTHTGILAHTHASIKTT